jgi:hypothetical protein
VSAVPPPTRVGAARRICPGTPRVQAACAADYTRAASRRGTSTAGSRCSSTPSSLLITCCVAQRWSARRESHPHTLAGPSSSGWCGCCFATSRRGAPGWFCPSDLRRVVPALFWLSYAGVGLPGRARTCGLPLRRRALCRLSYWELAGRAGLEPAPGSLKESCPWPLDERPELVEPPGSAPGSRRCGSPDEAKPLRRVTGQTLAPSGTAPQFCPAPPEVRAPYAATNTCAVWSRELDLPQRPPRYERDALTA